MLFLLFKVKQSHFKSFNIHSSLQKETNIKMAVTVPPGDLRYPHLSFPNQKKVSHTVNMPQ